MFAKYGMALFLSLLVAASLPRDAAAQNGNGNGGGGGDPVCWDCYHFVILECTNWQYDEEEDEYFCDPEDEVLSGPWHYFLIGGQGCPGGGGTQLLDPNGNGGGPGYVCARCGGTSRCHTADPETFDPETDPSTWEGVELGYCHVQCGPGGGEELALAIRDLEESLQTGNAEEFARVVRTSPSIQMLASGSVRLLPACGSTDAGTVLSVRADLAEKAARLLAE